MLLAQQPAALPAINLLHSALDDEASTTILNITSYRDLMFSNPDSLVSKLKWNDRCLRSLVGWLHPPLQQLFNCVPLAPCLSCFETCLPHSASRISKKGMRLIVRRHEVIGVSPIAATSLRPSGLLRAVVSNPEYVDYVYYNELSLYVRFKNSLSADNTSILVVRVLLEKGWTPERSISDWPSNRRRPSDKFSIWNVSDWQHALFNIKADMTVTENSSSEVGHGGSRKA